MTTLKANHNPLPSSSHPCHTFYMKPIKLCKDRHALPYILLFPESGRIYRHFLKNYVASFKKNHSEWQLVRWSCVLRCFSLKYMWAGKVAHIFTYDKKFCGTTCLILKQRKTFILIFRTSLPCSCLYILFCLFRRIICFRDELNGYPLSVSMNEHKTYRSMNIY